jgi:hypothetical protein
VAETGRSGSEERIVDVDEKPNLLKIVFENKYNIYGRMFK